MTVSRLKTMPTTEKVRDNVRKIVDASHTVPSLPENVIKALRIADSPDASVDNVAKWVEQDVGLASKMLQLANSAYYGFSSRVASVSHAIVLLGMKTTKGTLLTASMDEFFKKLPDRTKTEARHLWRHSMVCATTARLIAQQVPDADPEEAFTAGLLHDIGISVVFVNMPREFRKILDLACTNGTDFRDAEKQFWPYTHDLIGAEVLRRWELPDHIPQAIESHHTCSSNGPGGPLGAVIYLADRVALAPDTEDMMDTYFNEAVSNTEGLLDLTVDRVAEWLVDVMDTGAEEADVLLSVLQ